jgi:hypothetical protein
MLSSSWDLPGSVGEMGDGRGDGHEGDSVPSFVLAMIVAVPVLATLVTLLVIR